MMKTDHHFQLSAENVRYENDLLLLTSALDEPLKAEILALWEDYENARSAKAKAVKALDNLETILQHNHH
ncbi:hypothetical protein D3C78_1903390 [compost metagenome]